MRKNRLTNILFLVLLAGLLGIAGSCNKPDNRIQVAMIVSFLGYEGSEFDVPKFYFEKEGMHVTVVSTKLGTATGNGSEAKVDVTIKELDATKYDALVFVGGTGVEGLLNYIPVHKIAQDAVKANKVVAAICWAPIILANAGVLEGKKACASTNEMIIEANGGTVVNADVVVDGNIITANGPAASEKFSRAVINRLKELHPPAT